MQASIEEQMRAHAQKSTQCPGQVKIRAGRVTTSTRVVRSARYR